MDMRSNTMQKSVEKQKMREESQTFYIIKYYMFQKNLEKGGRDERDNLLQCIIMMMTVCIISD